jgi:hypothetical protein
VTTEFTKLVFKEKKSLCSVTPRRHKTEIYESTRLGKQIVCIQIPILLIRSIHKLRVVKIIFFSTLAVKQNEHNCKRDPTYSEYR